MGVLREKDHCKAAAKETAFQARKLVGGTEQAVIRSLAGFSSLHVILAVMTWFERKAAKYTLNRAIAGLIAFSCYGTAGFMQFVKYFFGHDSFYLYAGLLNIVLGCFMVYFFVRVLQVVKRQ